MIKVLKADITTIEVDAIVNAITAALKKFIQPALEC